MTPENPVLIFIPTYNESGNVRALFNEINSLRLKADVLFLDDNSPDGTGLILDEMAKEHQNLTIIHRSGKLGIGSAHKEGIRWAYQHGYSTLVTMDSDFSHSPEFITDFIRSAGAHDIVIGSRYMEKDSLIEWNLYRKFLTHLGHILTVNFLRMPYDASGAFRLYNLGRIPAGIFRLVSSDSYSFFFESLFILQFNKFRIKEIPISLPARTYGSSKMAYADIFRSLKFLLNLYLIRKFRQNQITWKEQS